ncbi:MAG: DHH family phosphoesterase, partial [Clostridia bacterium]|nr:DHH family phosphoesterase [Clostridia bacterium]
MQKWKLAVTDNSKIAELSRKYRIPALAAAVILPRTSDPAFNVENFVSANGVFRSPLLIRDMDKAAARLKKAVDDNERICIFGDYDADGVTSTAILYKYLKSLGCDVSYYIPDRLTEGYGMNNAAVRVLAEKGVELIVTVDNGISAYEQVELANSLGMEVIVTDHHTVPERMPTAVAVVDPHRKDDDSPFEHFCGAGVAFKLVMAMEGESCDLNALFDRFGSELAIGTVADVVALDDENRTAVKRGLRRINEGRNMGVRVLCDAADIKLGLIDAADIGFGIGPRINAAGRLGDATRALRLLITEDEDEAAMLSQELCSENNLRKDMIDKLYTESVNYL